MVAVEMNIVGAEGMQPLGSALAAACAAGQSIHLQGALGSGKTTLVRGILHALGYRDRVPSPSYALIESYPLSPFPVHHLDLYRLSTASSCSESALRPELECLGIRDYFDGSALCLVEWPGRAAALLPAPELQIRLEWAKSGRARRVRLSSVAEGGQKLLASAEKFARLNNLI